MNWDKIKQSWKKGNHTHTRDRKDKTAPYQCLECGKHYYTFEFGFNTIFLFFGGILIGFMLILDKLDVSVTEQTAPDLALLILPIMAATLTFFGIDPFVYGIRNIRRTDKTRLITKSLKLEYYGQYCLAALSGFILFIAGNLVYATFVIQELAKELHP